MDGVKSHEGQTAHDVYESKRVMHNETHEEVKEIHEVTKTDEGGIPEEVLGADDTNEGGQAQPGESK